MKESDEIIVMKYFIVDSRGLSKKTLMVEIKETEERKIVGIHDQIGGIKEKPKMIKMGRRIVK